MKILISADALFALINAGLEWQLQNPDNPNRPNVAAAVKEAIAALEEGKAR